VAAAAGHGHQVHMIGHQAVAQNPWSLNFRLLLQELQVHSTVIIGKEHILAVVAPLRDMMRPPWNHDPCNSRHPATLHPGAPRVNKQ